MFAWARELAWLLKHCPFGEGKMDRAVCAFVVGILGLGAGSAAQPNEIPLVTIRLHDYVRLPTGAIAAAQQHVTALYAAIGVRIVWAETVQPTAAAARFSKRDPGELLVNILTPAMSSRLAVRDEALGLAAVTPLDGGNVAYVLFGRICRLATASGTRSVDVLGVIIAHEVGHLLLPRGAHSLTGLMRHEWSGVDFKSANHRRLHFTGAQASSIHGLLSRRTNPASIGAKTLGQ
jgi:hypothetical protein